MVTNTVLDIWSKLTHFVQTRRRRSYTVTAISLVLQHTALQFCATLSFLCQEVMFNSFCVIFLVSKRVFMNISSMTPFSCFTQSFPKRASAIHLLISLEISSRGHILHVVGVVCSTVLAIKEAALSSSFCIINGTLRRLPGACRIGETFSTLKARRSRVNRLLRS